MLGRYSTRDTSRRKQYDYLFRGDVVSFISTCVKTTELFRESILALEKDKRDVLSLVERVEESEEAADTIRYVILENLFKNEYQRRCSRYRHAQGFSEYSG